MESGSDRVGLIEKSRLSVFGFFSRPSSSYSETKLLALSVVRLSRVRGLGDADCKGENGDEIRFFPSGVQGFNLTGVCADSGSSTVKLR